MSTNSKQNYLACIGDIVASKEVLDRAALQHKLSKVLDECNALYRDDLASNFMVTLGDEFQGLLAKPDHAIDIVHRIEQEIYPVKVRFGLGVGTMDTPIKREVPLGADGPAYHRARAAVMRLKESERMKQPDHGLMLISTDNANDQDRLMNAILATINTIKEDWSPHQYEVAYPYLIHGYSQTHLAQWFGIGQSSVQKRLAGAHVYVYQTALAAVTEHLMRWCM